MKENIDCRPCYRRFKVPECNKRTCLEEMKVDEVFNAAAKILARSPSFDKKDRGLLSEHRRRALYMSDVKTAEEAVKFQKDIYNRSFTDGPFKGVVADLSYRKRIDFALKFARPSSMVLDIGCGDGTIASGVAKKVKEILAIDVSDEAIKVATQYNNRNNIKYSLKSIEDFITDKKFDLILMFEIIEHLFNPRDVLRRVHNLLNASGKILISTPNFSRLTRIIKKFYGINHIRKIFGKDADRINTDHFREYTYQQIEEMMEESGFKVISHEGIIFWTDTVGGDIFRSLYPLQWLNFYLGSLIPNLAGSIFVAAEKVK